MKLLAFFVSLLLPLEGHAQTTIFSSDFDGNTGATVMAGNTDNTSGAPTLGVTWSKHASVGNLSNLTAISTGDSGTAGGFARLQNGSATYANANNIFLSRNHNLDSDRSTTKRGYSFTFTLTDSWDLATLTVLSGHTNNTGNSNQSYSSKLNLSISGGDLITPITANSIEDYGTAPAYHSVAFNLSGHTLGAGTYTVEVYQSDMTSGGAYAIYDGITLSGDNGLPPTPSITSFSSSKAYVTPGSGVTFSWITDGATNLTLNPGNISLLPFSTNGDGSTDITVNTSGTYTISAQNLNGTVTQSVSIFVGPPRPNIVFFLVDDMGPQDTSVPFNLDAEGAPKKYNFNNFYITPNMETLASQGMRFTNAYAQSVCSPTRTGLMTGRNSARHAVTDWVGGGGNGSPTNWRSQGLDHTDVTLPKLLQQGGYRTIHVGKGHFGQSGTTGADPLNLGFDVNIGGSRWGHPYSGYIGTAGYGGMPGLEAYDGSMFLTKALTIEANKALDEAVGRGQPFFLNMSFYAVHAPFTTNPDASGDYSGSTGSNHTKFATMIEGMDIAVGEIRQKLIDLNVAKNTLIVFLGDNGSDSPAVTVDGLPSGSFSDFPMRGKKGSKWEGGSRVPMIACWALTDATNRFQQAIPIPANSIETDIVTSWDLPATFLNAAGLPSANDFGEDSHSLVPYFSATPGTHRPQEIVIHYPHNHRSDFFSWIRQGDMKLIYNFQNNSHQLYHLASDPTESNNLAGSQPETLMQMSRALAQGLAERWGDRGALIPTTSTTAPSGNVVSIPHDPTVDSDNDGLPDTNEDPNFNGLVDPGETNPDNDNSDGDNIPDGDEVRLGTDPLDANSHFFCTPTKQADGSLLLTWPSAAGTSFTILSSTDLVDWTTVVTSGLPASAGSSTNYRLSPPLSGPLFFRVELDAATDS
ncbi:sulfatase-like hydrolase/transferase [Verrucomicrobiaceae bacterium N1E253]|uniref:Sulfatase-like hydrolase/transferase n=1 Tax=Oceaniferula marina TaxID=2748318 RepID=A0A851GK31_9BACT|nr:sulfatase-like hydrolase/transferase [Oceaniferula marina]NWK55070.1 sulfatase-like hydrolase/transferase [Oceaniferula marina]